MILVLNGSPNKKGNTMQVVSELIKDTNEDVVIYHAYEEKMAPCTDCKFCSYKKGCSIKDKMQSIYHLLEKTDTLIISSPLYFATLSGELINLLSRFQTYYAGKYVRKDQNPHIKRAIFVVTAGGEWEGMFSGVHETFRIMKMLFYIDEIKELFIPNCDEKSPLERVEIITKLKDYRQWLGSL